MRALILACLCATLPVAASAQAYRAQNWLTVVPLNTTDFEVIEDRGEGARGMWCAAADFAQNRLGRTQGRLYLKSPRGPSISGAGSIGAVFTVDASSLGVPTRTSTSVSVRDVGQGLLVNHAIQFCRDYQLELDDILFRRDRP